MLENYTLPVRLDTSGELVEKQQAYFNAVSASPALDAIEDRYDIEPGDIDQRLKDVFRLSFSMSNGSPLLQCFYQFDAVRIMRTCLQDEDLFRDAVDNLRLLPEDYLPPKNHKPLNRTKTLFRVAQIARIYKDICVNNSQPQEVREDVELVPRDWLRFKLESRWGIHLFTMLGLLAERDMAYLSGGRPNSVSNVASRRSFFKSYVLDLMPTGSPEVDYTNSLLRATLDYQLQPGFEFMHYMEVMPVIRYKPLGIKWESLHDGQFWPAEISECIGQPAIGSGVSGTNWEFSDY